MTEFTPVSALIGGGLIGLAATMLMLLQGRIAGISGILAGALRGGQDGWQVAFITGLALSALVAMAAGGGDISVTDNPFVLVAGGLLVGVGTALGSGCTSGHGVCGIARLSPRSILATGTFMVVAIATVFVVRHLIGA